MAYVMLVMVSGVDHMLARLCREWGRAALRVIIADLFGCALSVSVLMQTLSTYQ